MGANTLRTVKNKDVIMADDVNQFHQALTDDILPRNNLGAITHDNTTSLGDLAAPWPLVRARTVTTGAVLFKQYNDQESPITDFSDLTGTTEVNPGELNSARFFLVSKGGSNAGAGGGAALIFDYETPQGLTKLRIDATGGDITITEVFAEQENQLCKVTHGTNRSDRPGSLGAGGVIALDEKLVNNIVYVENNMNGVPLATTASGVIIAHPSAGTSKYAPVNVTPAINRGIFTYGGRAPGYDVDYNDDIFYNKEGGSLPNQNQTIKIFWSV